MTARTPTFSQRRNLLLSPVLPFGQLQKLEIFWHHAKPLTAVHLNISWRFFGGFFVGGFFFPKNYFFPERKPQRETEMRKKEKDTLRWHRATMLCYQECYRLRWVNRDATPDYYCCLHACEFKDRTNEGRGQAAGQGTSCSPQGRQAPCRAQPPALLADR